MAESKFKTKKEWILDMSQQAPTLTNTIISDYTGASLGYVNQILGKNRVPQRKYRVRKDVNIWQQFKKQQNDFIVNNLPVYEYKHEHKDFREDFVNYHLPTDDQWGSGSGEDLSGSWSQYEYLAEKRIGVGPKVTRFPAEDAVREGFQFIDHKTKKIVPKPEIEQWLDDTDFMNELARVIYFERVYGIGYLLAYYSKNDKEKGIMAEEVKEGSVPVAFEAHVPTILTPINVYESDKLDKNPQKWNFMGGMYDPQTIDHTRIRVFMSRPVFGRWYGLSIFEPIWDSVIPYYQALLFLLRGFVKWGNLIPMVTIPGEDDLEALFDKNVDVIEDMKMNGTFIFPMGSTITFENTKLAAGLRDMMEIWIEDISAGTGIPVPKLMGRVVSAGLSGVGYLVAERDYWTMIKNIQHAFTDDVKAILKHAGFDLEGLDLHWNLTITKTDQQRLMDEGMEIQNQMLEEQLVQTKLQTLLMVEQLNQARMMTEDPQAFQGGNGGVKTGGGGNGAAKKGQTTTPKAKKDFIIDPNLTTDLVAKILEDRREILKMMWGGGNNT